MKKIVIALIVVCIAATMAFVGVGCKTTTETTAAGAETTAAGSETTAAAEAADTTATAVAGKELKIVHIPKVVHPWFDIVQKGAERMAKDLTEQTGTKVTVEYIAPPTADVAVQNGIIEQAAAKGATGIFIDPLDEQGNKQIFDEIRAKGVLITVYDCSPFADYTAVAASAEDSATYELTRLVSLIGEKGKVAVMQGFPTAPSHKQRYDVLIEGLKKYPNITVVDGGIDNDDMGTARQQAAATIAANPDLVGYLGCDAAFPVGVAQAIKEAGKVGQIQAVGIGEMVSILDYVKEGVLESTVYIAPDLQGAYSVLLHWMASMGYYKQGVQIPKFIDIGCSYIDKTNVDEYLARFK
ncbi:MAG: substrate-binding domain-containing protein [Candidatus Humimicrobiaceae bacterium]